MLEISTAQRRRTLLLLLGQLALPALAPLTVQAQSGQPIWRCGSRYSDQPCDSGRLITPDAAPSSEARAAADAATQRTGLQAEAMAREREYKEAAAAARAPAVIEHRSHWTAEEASKEQQLQKPKRPKVQKGRLPKDQGFTARGPAASKPRKAH